MKTFRRFQSHPSAVHIYAQHHSRWKRKNKYRQLKNTITKLKAENEAMKRELSKVCVWLEATMLSDKIKKDKP